MDNFNKALEESFNFINTFQLNIFGPDKDGTLWQPIYNQVNGVGVTDSILYYYQTPYFTLVQRTQSKWLYINNAYAQSGINNLVNMIFGAGFQYKCEDESTQIELDNWIKRNNFHHKARECAQKFFVEGETFYRLFDSDDSYKDIRFVMPQYVYDEKDNGIHTDPTDYEKVEYYTISKSPPERVDADDMQHRKNAWSEEKRGVSILYSIGPALLEATGLLQSLCQTAKALSKIAWIRYHEANQSSVQQFRGDIAGQQNAQFNGLTAAKQQTNENVEFYAPGSILDLPNGVKAEFPGQYIDGDKYISVLRAVLRLCAARFGLPENVLSQDQDSMGAYTASLVNDSHCVKGLKIWQEKFAEWDLNLFEKAGFDTNRIKVELPEIAINNKNEQVIAANFLLNAQLASKSTVAASFGLDYSEEEKIIATEPKTEPVIVNKDTNGNK